MHHKRMFVTLIEGNNEFLQFPARGLLEVLDTDYAGRVTKAYFSNVSPEYPSEPAPPVLVSRPVFIYDPQATEPTEAPVTPQEVLNIVRRILAQHGPDLNSSSIDDAYKLIERIERDGIVGANKDTL